MSIFDALRLIPALQAIFTSGIEFQGDSFVELTREQHESVRRHGAKASGTLYRIAHVEPESIERTREKVTLELTIVDGSERQLLLDGIKFIYRSSAAMTKENPTFAERLDYLRLRLPPIVCQSQ